MLVLIVEDDESIAAPLAKGLAREGFEVERLTSGQAAAGFAGGTYGVAP